MSYPCDQDPDLWFDTKVENRRKAQRACMDCHIIDQCRAGAIERDELHGVWGGMDFTSERTRPTPIDHGTEAGATAHRRRGERPCESCRQGAIQARRRREDAA